MATSGTPGALSVSAPSWAPDSFSAPASTTSAGTTETIHNNYIAKIGVKKSRDQQFNLPLNYPPKAIPSPNTAANALRWAPAATAHTGTRDASLVPQAWPRVAKRRNSPVASVRAPAGVASAGRLPANQVNFKIIPESVWTPSYARNPSLFQIADPVARFRKVNVSAPEGVIDLHYQTKASCRIVLDAVLPEYEGSRLGGVWVVTGTGHHRGGHQAEGVLFATCKSYLGAKQYAYVIGKTRGGSGGARVSGALFVSL
jgi:DNA-nicking Smr family endonuclease